MKKRICILLLSLLTSVTGAFSQSKTVSGGNDHGLIICAQGYLYTWGNNYSSTIGGPLLGIDPNYSSVYNDKVVYSPQRVKTDGLTFSQVTAGSGAFNLALSCTKLVYAWGDNQNKECGQGASSGNIVDYPSPVLKGETPGYALDGTSGGDYLGGVKYIAASTNSGFAILEDGSAVGWGSGSWNPNSGAAAGLPAYILDENGKKLQNVTHITAGDDNCYFMVDDDGDGAGKLYAIGPWNGQTDGAVTYAREVMNGDGEVLDNIRMSAAGDVCGFAVTGDGYVWSWGNGGWGGSTGQGVTKTTQTAEKVVAGDYKAISGETYLTDVVEVIGGRGHGAAITKEGYLLYWGCNDDNGGVVPDPEYTTDAKKGPVFAFYCKEGTSDERGDTVKNAVSISRGDNFDFMINDKDEYYVWGLNDLGQSGTGDKGVDEYYCLTKLENMPCDPQDNCPTAFLPSRSKCPGEEIELDCGFTVPKGKEDRYYIKWYFNGTLLNTSTVDSPSAERLADIYNNPAIKIDEPGEYTVILEYIGGNIPCDKCEPVEVTCTVTDMKMPVDTTITVMNCVAEPLAPSASDVISYAATVNSNFYKAGQTTSWAAFSTETSTDTLATVKAKGPGSDIEFSVTGDKIDAAEIHDNSAEESKDTTYTVWLEDITSFETYLYKDQELDNSGSFQSYGLLLNMYSAAELKSFQIAAKGYSGTSTITVKPTIYQTELDDNGQYVVGAAYWTGEEQSFDITSDEANYVTVKCGVKLPVNVTRGTTYILGMTFTGNASLYNFKSSARNQSNSTFVTPIIDTEEFGIYAFGATANSYTKSSNGSDNLCYSNVCFGKLTDYDCGRIQVTARYGCPPCNQPDGIIKIASTETADDDNVVALCKGESTTLSVTGVAKAANPDAAFDILWFDKPTMLDADALKSDAKATESSYSIAWDDLTPGESKMIYMKIRDNEKPTASACWVLDSITVKADTVPVVPAVTIDPYCEGKLDLVSIAAIAAKFAFSGYTTAISNGTIDDMSALQLTSELSTLTAGDHIYTLTNTDKNTGCVSEPLAVTITVNPVPEKPATAEVAMLKESAYESVGTGATADLGNTLIWYTTTSLSDPSAIAPNQNKAEAGTYYYYVSQQTAEGCVSDTATVTVVVNDAPKPNVRDTVICKGDDLTLSSLVTALSAEYQINWYTSADATKGTGSTAASTIDATVPGEYTFYVSQTNLTTSAESEKASFIVTVAGVSTPVVTETATYCAGSEAASIATMAKLYSDETTYYYADNLVYYDEFGVAITDAAKLTPSTDVTTTTTYTYSIAESYTIKSSGEVCLGTSVPVTVTVEHLDAPRGDLSVNYLKTDGAATGSFLNLTRQNASVAMADEGASLVWYNEDKTLCNGTGTVPTPTYDANQTDDVVLTYYVSQRNSNGCESEMVPVTVTISTAPMPTTTNLAYCEGETGKELTSNANISLANASDSKDNYELVWYGQQNPNELTTAEQKAALEVAVPTASTELADAAETFHIYTYYVAQRNTKTGAVSRASVLYDTVYAHPQLSINTVPAVCEPQTVNLNNSSLWAVSSAVNNIVIAWTDDTGSAVSDVDVESVSESKTYYVSAYFKIYTSGTECKSENIAPIEVNIHHIRGLEIDGEASECPGNQDILTPKFTDVDPETDLQFSWVSDKGDAQTSGISGSTAEAITTPSLNYPAGTVINYTLTASAGACTGAYASTANFTITVGDGPVVGTLNISETDNKTSNDYTASKSGIVFYSCGNDVTLDASNILGGNFTWVTDPANPTTTQLGTGATYSLPAANRADETTLYLYYVNNCSTYFPIVIKNVPITVDTAATNPDICEGESFHGSVAVTCSDACVVNWYQDGVVLPQYEGKSELVFDPATPSQNGVYTYVVTNRACSVDGEIAFGKKLTVRPQMIYTVQKQWIAPHDTKVTMPITFTVPSSDPQLISWTENGDEVSTSNPYSLTVTEDHHYVINFSDADYCSSSTEVDVLSDANLSLSIDLPDVICSSDFAELIIDTAGTGKFLDNSARLYIEATTIKGVTSTYTGGWTLNAADGKLHYTVSPKDTTTYKVVFAYREGQTTEQIKEEERMLIVLPPITITQAESYSACGDGSADMEIAVNVSPSDVVINWDEDDDITSDLNRRTAVTVSPTFEEEGHANDYYYKAFTLTGSYSLCQAQTASVTIRIDRPLTGAITGPEIVCEGKSSTISADSYRAESYLWSSDDDDAANGMTTSSINVNPVYDPSEYSVDMTRGMCNAKADWTITVSTLPRISEIDSLYYDKREVIMMAGYGTEPFYMWLDDNVADSTTSTVFENVDYGKHVLNVVDAAGCTTTGEFNVVAPDIDIPTILTPQGDLKNDYFTSKIIQDAFPNAVITIFDRYGKQLVKYKGADQGWDGTYNGHPMPTTDYWYEIEVKSIGKTYTGHFTLLRQ